MPTVADYDIVSATRIDFSEDSRVKHDFPLETPGIKVVPGEFRICRHFYPRVQDELSQSFDFPIFAIRQWCAKNPVSSDAAQL
jgi:hypothetical protein